MSLNDKNHLGYAETLQRESTGIRRNSGGSLHARRAPADGGTHKKIQVIWCQGQILVYFKDSTIVHVYTPQ